MLFNLFISVFSANIAAQNYKSRYKIVSLDMFEHQVDVPARVITTRYIPIPFDLESPKKYFFTSFDTDTLLCSGIEIIFEDDFYKLSTNNHLEIGSEIYSFLTACVFLNTKMYDEAIAILSQEFEEPRFDFLRRLLLADCMYDKNMDRKSAINTSFQYYQDAHDATEDTLSKTLVKARLNYIRHNEK